MHRKIAGIREQVRGSVLGRAPAQRLQERRRRGGAEAERKGHSREGG